MLNDEQVRALIREKIAEAGTIKKWSTDNGLSTPYVSDVLNGRRDLAPKVLAAVGLTRVVTYEPLRRG